jgi:hypothetical protein
VSVMASGGLAGVVGRCEPGLRVAGAAVSGRLWG